MMGSIFLELLNRSINAGWLVLAVVLLRKLLKKAPKTLFIVLWALVGIRLVCPFSPESAFSLIPSAEPIPITAFYSESIIIDGAEDKANGNDVNIITPAETKPIYAAEPAAVGNGAGNDPSRQVDLLLTAAWAAGMLGLLAYAAISSVRLRRRVRESVPLRENIRLCDRVDTPFLLGLVRPRIYLPSSLTAEDAEYAIAHERAHVQRRDHWWKPLGFLLLAVYWFNPLMWVAYVLLCRDIELACDEKVIRRLGAGSKKPYSLALINCSVPRRVIAFCPLAFGEVAVKERVNTVLHYKKPSFWLSSVAVLACVASALCFLTDPIGTAEVLTQEPSVQPSVEAQAPAGDVDDSKVMHVTSNGYFTAEETAFIHAVLGKRIQVGYASYDIDEYGNRYECYNYELPAEIVEKYGTRDCEKLPTIYIFESKGELDATETFEMYYGSRDYYFEGEALKHTDTIKRTVVYEVVIPAGGVAFCVLDPGDDTLLGGKNISATYGDLTVVFDD